MSAIHSLWTIGHSTHSLETFIEMLLSFNIEVVADVRSLPGSRKFPQFDQENLIAKLPEAGIQYIYLKNLGGRRRMRKDSDNTGWRSVSFRGYADYMETDQFKAGIAELEQIASQKRTAIMCAEAVWWRCHRSLVSDYMKWKGWNICHIMGIGQEKEHPYTAPAHIINGQLSYKKDE